MKVLKDVPLSEVLRLHETGALDSCFPQDCPETFFNIENKFKPLSSWNIHLCIENKYLFTVKTKVTFQLLSRNELAKAWDRFVHYPGGVICSYGLAKDSGIFKAICEELKL